MEDLRVEELRGETGKKVGEDSYAREAEGSHAEALGNAASWSWSEPFYMAWGVFTSQPEYFLGLAAIASLVDLVPLGGMLWSPVLSVLAMLVAYQHLLSPEPIETARLVQPWWSRMLPLGGVYLLLWGLQALLAGGLALGAGLLCFGVLAAQGGEPTSMGKALVGLIGGGGVLLWLLTSTALGALFSFAHEECVLFEASPWDALTRSARRVPAAGLSLLGFFLTFMGVHFLTSLGLGLGVSLFEFLGAWVGGLIGLQTLGYWGAWLVGNFLGSAIGAWLHLLLGMAWTYRFLHDRARLGV